MGFIDVQELEKIQERAVKILIKQKELKLVGEGGSQKNKEAALKLVEVELVHLQENFLTDVLDFLTQDFCDEIERAEKNLRDRYCLEKNIAMRSEI